MTPHDIFAAALAMVRRYGETAAAEATARARQRRTEGDVEGQQAWLQIARAIGELQRQMPSEGESVH